MKTITVVDYDPAWPAVFETLRTRLLDALGGLAASIEHVGSTAVPGLAAKPVIDIDVVVRSPADVPEAITRLTTLGYVHRGQLGVDGREAFRASASLPRHHLYLCVERNLALENHLAIREALRASPALAAEYAVLKQRLAAEFPHDGDRYTAGKTGFLLSVLRQAGWTDDLLAGVERANRVFP